jgi:hypothetical protein
MARNREREKFVAGIKVGDIVVFHGVKCMVTGIPLPSGFTAEEAAKAGIVNQTTIYVRPLVDEPMRILRNDVQTSEGEDY